MQTRLVFVQRITNMIDNTNHKLCTEMQLLITSQETIALQAKWYLYAVNTSKMFQGCILQVIVASIVLLNCSQIHIQMLIT